MSRVGSEVNQLHYMPVAVGPLRPSRRGNPEILNFRRVNGNPVAPSGHPLGNRPMRSEVFYGKRI